MPLTPEEEGQRALLAWTVVFWEYYFVDLCAELSPSEYTQPWYLELVDLFATDYVRYLDLAARADS